MNFIKLSMKISNSSRHRDLGVELWLDETKFFDNNVCDTVYCSTLVPDEDSTNHQLKIILKGKQPHHTVIDEFNNILEDALIEVSDVVIDDIDIGTIMYKSAIYTHDTNGTQPLQDYPYTGFLGCNGIVTIEFKTPLWEWFLESMNG